MSRISILMVEDSPLDADLIQARLAAGGIDCDCRRVETREDFLAALDDRCFDVILADYSLPSFDGLGALEIARRRCPGVPFIFVSGVLGEEVAIDTLQKGATDYVLKQRMHRLAPAVRRALDETRERVARHRAEEGLRIAAETARLGFWQMDIATGVIDATAGCTANFGLPADAPVTREALLAHVHPDDRPAFGAMLDRAGSVGDSHNVECRTLWPDGSTHWLIASGRTVSAPEGTPPRLVGVTVDITDRKRGEMELTQAKEAAEQASHAKDHFLAVLSHELRTPLTPILTTIHLMETEPGLPAEMREHLRVICRNVELEARLIDDLLDLTRITRGKLQLHTEPVDVHAVIRGTLDICASELRDKRHEVTVDLAAEQRTVTADAARLQQVLWNLLKNAVKFSPAGGGITVRTRNAGDGGGEGTGSVIIEVQDAGIGIEPAALSRIFNAFEQADGRVSRHYGGLGLGLAIARELVEMHGGALSAHSDGPGKGATFTVTLPTMRQADAAALQRVPAVRPAVAGISAVAGDRPRLRILLVEDHADTARAMSSLLKRRGHDVRHATTVMTAIGLVGAEKFDLLISDLGLPDGSGLDVVARPEVRGIPAIALTGYGSDDDVARCRQAGFAQHLTKPVNIDKLDAAIRQLARETAGNT